MTYPEVAAELGVKLCLGCAQYMRHEKGEVRHTKAGPVLHWRDRPLNKMGLRRFLTLVVRIQYPHIEGWPLWRQLHTQNTIAASVSYRIFHRRLPRHLADQDRARVRYLLHEVPDWEKRSWDKSTWTAYRSATRWAWPA